MSYLVNRYIRCTEEVTSENRSEPYFAELIYEAIRIGTLIERIKRKTPAQKRMYRTYKKHDKRLETILDFKDLNYTLSPEKKEPPKKPYYHTKVEKIDQYGIVVETILL